MTIQTMGIIGAAGIGGELTRNCLAAGFAVTLVDKDRDALAQTRARIGAWLDDEVARGSRSEAERAAVLKRFACSTQVADFHNDDFVIATGCDDSLITRQTLLLTEAALSEYAIIASDAPPAAAKALSHGLRRPGKLIGLNLAASAMPEPVRWPATSDETVALVAAFVSSLEQLAAH